MGVGNYVSTYAKLPKATRLSALEADCETLLIFPDGSGYFITAGKGKGEIIPALTMGGFTAIGSGAHFALGAMEHGATAIQAFRIACKRATDCGLPPKTG
jgi:ATP-dependent protease HslVU (ClpYQ) peptidase subunit